ncbi:hypothetical protein GCM10010399_44140 [Dactylosporangium fulvum]|uniref:Uncharacterized protein n=1 Tax=Dactylosporangium fulvum TaxID=53359 RepID=A0ABY5WA71_9ACTN|nr:hypothetical protein [Dactylosporangium fulvum]UWP85919.1 hypothetical protein Dfulv_17370 [Dactylosporangium fulvum]
MPFNNPVTDGARGGRARAKKLSPERRSEIARDAAFKRVAVGKRVEELENIVEELYAQVAELRAERVAA